MTTSVYVLLILIGLVIFWLIIVYNGLIRSKNQVQEGWSDINVQLKRRYDLIPNLVTTVKGYAQHEDKVLNEVTKARNVAMGANTAKDKMQAENMLSETLKTLFAVSENYPDLKANANFAKLQDELTDTENKIQAARRFYNGLVRDYNTKLEVFPTNLIAGQLGFKAADFFELKEEVAKQPVAVKF